MLQLLNIKLCIHHKINYFHSKELLWLNMHIANNPMQVRFHLYVLLLLIIRGGFIDKISGIKSTSPEVGI